MADLKSNPYEGMVCISTLPPTAKRKAWLFIQEHRPELAAQIGVDKKTVIGEFQRLFGAALWLPMEDTGLTAADLPDAGLAAAGSRLP